MGVLETYAHLFKITIFRTENAMDETIRDDGVWIPFVHVGRHERSGDFKVIRYGAKEDSGISYVVGDLCHIGRERMASSGLRIILKEIAAYRVWPAKKKLNSELKAMEPKVRSKFLREHLFVDVQKREEKVLTFTPCHQEGIGWGGMTSYMQEEIPLILPTEQNRFYAVLMHAFDLAT